MSIYDKIQNAKPTTWITDGIPKWEIVLIVYLWRIKAKLYRHINRKRKETR